VDKLVFLSLLLLTTAAFADGSKQDSPPVIQSTQSTPDPRMPPMLPGETVNRQRQKLRVITTAGSLAGSPANTAPAPNSSAELNGPADSSLNQIDVIVDGRKFGSDKTKAPAIK